MERSCGDWGLQGWLVNLLPAPPLQPQASCMSSAAPTLSPPSLSRGKSCKSNNRGNRGPSPATRSSAPASHRPAQLHGLPCAHSTEHPRDGKPESPPFLPSAAPSSPQLFSPSLPLHTAPQGARKHATRAAFHFTDDKTEARGGEQLCLMSAWQGPRPLSPRKHQLPQGKPPTPRALPPSPTRGVEASAPERT